MNFDADKVYAPEHTRQIFDPETFQHTVDRMVAKVKKLRDLHPEIEAIAATGMSGLLLAGAISARLCLPVLAVRKTMDTHHDDKMVNGYLGVRGYLFVDDLICSGKTLAHVVLEISRVAPAAKLVGCVLYDSGAWSNRAIWAGSAETGMSLATRSWGVRLDHENIDWESNRDARLAEELGGPCPKPYEAVNAQQAQLWRGKVYTQQLVGQEIVTYRAGIDTPIASAMAKILPFPVGKVEAGVFGVSFVDTDIDPSKVLVPKIGARYGAGWTLKSIQAERKNSSQLLSEEDIKESYEASLKAADSITTASEDRPPPRTDPWRIPDYDDPYDDPYFDPYRGRWSYD